MKDWLESFVTTPLPLAPLFPTSEYYTYNNNQKSLRQPLALKNTYIVWSVCCVCSAAANRLSRKKRLRDKVYHERMTQEEITWKGKRLLLCVSYSLSILPVSQEPRDQPGRL